MENRHIHHGEVRMLLDARFFHPECRITLQELLIDNEYGIECQYLVTYTADQALRILVHGSVLRELQLVLQYSIVHVRVIIGPKWRLHKRFSDGKVKQVYCNRTLTIPVSIS